MLVRKRNCGVNREWSSVANGAGASMVMVFKVLMVVLVHNGGSGLGDIIALVLVLVGLVLRVLVLVVVVVLVVLDAYSPQLSWLTATAEEDTVQEKVSSPFYTLPDSPSFPP